MTTIDEQITYVKCSEQVAHWIGKHDAQKQRAEAAEAKLAEAEKREKSMYKKYSALLERHTKMMEELK